jgi:hypothetical protein
MVLSGHFNNRNDRGVSKIKITKCSLFLIISILFSTKSTAATVRWDIKPSHFIGGEGVFAGNNEGTISGWFQFDAANPFDNSRYSFVFQTTTVSENPIRGYTYSSFNFESGHPTGTINLVDSTAFTIIGFVLIQNLEFRFP